MKTTRSMSSMSGLTATDNDDSAPAHPTFSSSKSSRFSTSPSSPSSPQSRPLSQRPFASMRMSPPQQLNSSPLQTLQHTSTKRIAVSNFLQSPILVNRRRSDASDTASEAGGQSVYGNQSIAHLSTAGAGSPLLAPASDSSEPHFLAYRGKVVELFKMIKKDPTLLNAKYQYSTAKLLSPMEEVDDTYQPPHHIPKLVRAALQVDNILAMSREQRWLLQNSFGSSSLLHYACCGKAAQSDFLCHSANISLSLAVYRFSTFRHLPSNVAW
jgi:hypothetical protein